MGSNSESSGIGLVRLAVVCPLKAEFHELQLALESKGFESSTLNRFKSIPARYFPQLDLVLAVGGHGKTQFGISSQYLLSQLPDLSLYICTGCAGALHSDLCAGDVVIAETTMEHDYRERFVSRPVPRFSGSEKAIRTVREHIAQIGADKSFPRVHFGPVASGDEDIVDRARATELRNFTQAIAVAWEGAGGARACKFNQIEFLEIRGITDGADQLAANDFAANLTLAMKHVAQVTVTLATLWS